MNKQLGGIPQTRALARARTLRRRAIRSCMTIAVVMGAVLGVGLQQASATLITTTHSFQLEVTTRLPNANEENSLSLPFDQFDPTLGMLTGLTIEVETWAFWIWGALEVSNTSESCQQISGSDLPKSLNVKKNNPQKRLYFPLNVSF